MATRILLLRHAQSTWNAEGRWQGWADAPLTSSGEEAVAAVATDPTLDPVAGVVASDLERAWRTGSIIADARRLPAVTTMRGLRERGAGLWTGLTRPEIEEGWPGAFAAPITIIPGGEARRAVLARALGALHRIADAWPSVTVLTVTHGGVIRLVEEHLGAPHEPVPNLGGRWLEVDVGHMTLSSRVTLAAVADLDPIASAEQ